MLDATYMVETADDPDSSGLIIERVGNTFLVLEAKVCMVTNRQQNKKITSQHTLSTEPI